MYTGILDDQCNFLKISSIYSSITKSDNFNLQLPFSGTEKSRFPKSLEECPEEDRITYLAAVAEFEPTTRYFFKNQFNIFFDNKK